MKFYCSTQLGVQIDIPVIRLDLADQLYHYREARQRSQEFPLVCSSKNIKKCYLRGLIVRARTWRNSISLEDYIYNVHLNLSYKLIGREAESTHRINVMYLTLQLFAKLDSSVRNFSTIEINSCFITLQFNVRCFLSPDVPSDTQYPQIHQSNLK